MKLGFQPINLLVKKINSLLNKIFVYRIDLQKGNRTIAPEENCPPVRVRVRVSFRVGGQFSPGAIVLEPFKSNSTNHYNFLYIPLQLFVYFYFCSNLLKVQSCKLYNKKYIIASAQITNTKILAFIAILVFKLLSRKVLFINRKDNRNC